MCEQDDREVSALQKRYADLEAFLQQLKAAESAGEKTRGPYVLASSLAPSIARVKLQAKVSMGGERAVFSQAPRSKPPETV